MDFVQNYEPLLEPDDQETCEEALKSTAFVDIAIAPEVITQAKRSPRVSFWDTLSGLGKEILGLLC